MASCAPAAARVAGRGEQDPSAPHQKGHQCRTPSPSLQYAPGAGIGAYVTPRLSVPSWAHGRAHLPALPGTHLRTRLLAGEHCPPCLRGSYRSSARAEHKIENKQQSFLCLAPVNMGDHICQRWPVTCAQGFLQMSTTCVACKELHPRLSMLCRSHAIRSPPDGLKGHEEMVVMAICLTMAAASMTPPLPASHGRALECLVCAKLQACHQLEPNCHVRSRFVQALCFQTVTCRL